jgi:hypothetical protein
MAYLKPPLFTRRVFNPLAKRTGIGGSQVLRVPGRRTGNVEEIPVIPVKVDGATYVVSARGETEWVRNVRVAGRLELGPHGSLTTYRAEELPVGDSGAIITRYREVAGRTVAPYWSKLPADADHPVFRLTAA